MASVQHLPSELTFTIGKRAKAGAAPLIGAVDSEEICPAQETPGPGPGRMRRGMQMKQDIGSVAHRLAGDQRISDYDFWRALKNLDNEIYRMSGDHQPIPLEMIRWRAIIKQARSRRGFH